MYPSLINDELDDWERQRRETEQLAALLPPEEAPTPMMPPLHSSEPVEMAPLHLDTGPDWTDALGVGTTALAALADLGLNHGRGTGQILASGGAYGAARAEQRMKQAQDAMLYEQKRAELAKSNRYNDYLYASMAQRANTAATSHADRVVSQGQRQQDLTRKEATEARQAENQDPSEFISWAADRGYDLRGLQTMAQARSAMGPLAKQWDLEHAGEKAGATAAGRIGAELDLSGATGDAAAERALKVQTATQPGAIARIEAGARARAAAERAATGDKKIGNTEVIDPDVYSSLSQKQVNDANDISRSKVQFEQAMDDMAALQGTEGMQVLPSGRKASYEAAQGAAIGSLTKLFETGVINEQEYKRYVERIPPAGMSAGGVIGAATGQNIVGDQIRGTRDELSKIFDAGLSQFGLRGKRAAAPSATPEPSTDLPTNFGVTAPPGVRNTPDFPGGAPRARNGLRQATGNGPMGGNMQPVMMRDPEGEVGPVPPSLVQQAESAGYVRVQ